MAAFRAFLKTEFSEENLEFWLACEDFKRTRSAAKLASRAHRIFEEFVDVQAPREVRWLHLPIWPWGRGYLPQGQWSSLAAWAGVGAAVAWSRAASLLCICTPVGEHRLPDPRSHEEEHGGALSELLRPSPGQGAQPHGKGLLPSIPEVQNVLGFAIPEPEEAQLGRHSLPYADG